MPVTLSDEQYSAIKTALVTIARGKKVNQCGNERAIFRGELMNEAREACDSARIEWSGDLRNQRVENSDL